MFDIGWSEMAVIMLVALVVIGPKDLPRLARTLGQWIAKGRSMAREFQRSLEDMAREAELDDVKREIEKIGRTDIKKSIEKSIDPTGELGKAFDPTAASKARDSKAVSVKPAASSAANGGAKPGPAQVAPESEPAPPESKPAEAKPAEAKPPEAKPPEAKPPQSRTPKSKTKSKTPKSKPEAISAEPR